MESTGAMNKIQISESTAALLKQSGKQHWIKPREDAVKAKGKGVLSTFWLNPTGGKEEGSSAGSDTNVDASLFTSMSDNNDRGPRSEARAKASAKSLKHERLVDWMVEILLDHIKKIVSSFRIPNGSGCGCVMSRSFRLLTHCCLQLSII